MNLPKVKIEKDVGIITLSNPKSHNSLTLNVIERISEVIIDWNAKSIKAIIITGEGKSFCSGMSINEINKEVLTANPIGKLCTTLENFEGLTICALNGGVYGGAVEIALSCDFRIGHPAISMFVPASKLGIHYEPMGICRSINILGAQMTRRIFLLAEKFSGVEMFKFGFIDFMAKNADEVIIKSKEKAKLLTGSAPLAVNGMKATIVDLLHEGTFEKKIRDRIERCLDSQDHFEALQAYRDKRKPVFQGK